METKSGAANIENRTQTFTRIQIDAKDSKKGFYTLLTNGTVGVERDNKYVVPSYCLPILTKEKITFKVLKG